MSLKKYKKVKYLGKGSYGAAILVHLRSNKAEKFVIKEIVIGHMPESEKESTMNEVEVLRQMHHSNIAMYVESFIEGSRLYIVMEFADGGDLSGAIQRRKDSKTKWPENEVMRMFVQVCLALKHVHEQNILHRDLKSQNIFLTSKGIVKLGDFGIAKVLDGTDAQARTQIGTPYYLSPEICESKPYGRSSDMWSLGVVLFELLALELPFTAQSLPALVIKICTSDPKWDKIESSYSPPIIDICQNLLLKDCDARPTVTELLKSDYLMVHISKLLSHTIKMGKGGAEGAAIGANVDEVDKSIERERLRLKQEEKNEAENQKQAEKQAQREENREKIRRLKAQRKRQQQERQDEDVVYCPSDKSVALPIPSNERASSDVDQALAEAARREELRLKKQQEQYERRLAEQQRKHEEELQQQSKSRSDAASRVGDSPPPFQRQVGGSRDSEQAMYGHQRKQMSVVSSAPGAAGTSDAARREFFANRAAAQQIKAKVEAYERGGSHRHAQHLDAGIGMEVSVGNARNASDWNHRVDRSSSSEERIAQVRAQRQREQQLEQAEKERQLQQAYEETRRERMRIAALRKSEMESNATEYSDSQDSHNERRRRRELKKEEDIKRNEEMLREARNKRPPRDAGKRPGAIAFSIDFSDVSDSGSDIRSDKKPPSGDEGGINEVRSRSNSEVSESESVQTVNNNAPSGRQRRSWGAPIAPPRGKIKVEDDDEDASEVPDGTAVRKLYGTAQEIAEDEEAVLKCLEARDGREEQARIRAKEAFRKLREQKRREARLYQKNKRTPDRQEPRPPSRPPPPQKERKRQTPPRGRDEEKSFVQEVDSSDGNDFDNADGEESSSRRYSPPDNIRLSDIVGQVEKAKEEVSKVIADARENRGYARNRDIPSFPNEATPPRDNSDSTARATGSTSSTQKTTVRNHYGRTGQRISLGDDEIFAYSSEDDSDDHEKELEKTLDSWLSKESIKSKRCDNKSMAKANNLGHTGSFKGSLKEVRASQDFSHAVENRTRAEAKLASREDENSSAAKSSTEVVDENDDYEPSEDEDENEDGEVAGLQCWLAKELMSENSSSRLT